MNSIKNTALLMYKYLLLMSVALMATYTQSQSIRIDRVDVDSTRSGIVTAGYGFELQISLDEIENVNNVSFKLVFDNQDVISFSEFAYGDFDDPDNVLISKPKQGENSLSVTTFSGTALEESDLDSPEVITLRFTVSKRATNGNTVNFSFENAFATSYNAETGGESIELSGTDFEFDIHGFVDVWPGDANADGTVDAADQSTIGLYLGEGSLTPNMRAFRRESPSTRFYPQKVLLWDIPEITFADCDGDGDVTVEDGMVVFMNEGKITGQSDAGAIGGNGVSDISSNFSEIVYSDKISRNIEQLNKADLSMDSKNSKLVYPLYIHSDRQWESIVVELQTNNQSGSTILSSVESGNLLGDGFAYLAYQSEKAAEILIGEFGSEEPFSKSGHIADLVFAADSKVTSSDIIIKSIIGMDASGAKFQITEGISSVESVQEIGLIKFIEDNPAVLISVSDITGRLLGQWPATELLDAIAHLEGALMLSSAKANFKLLK